jgi:hypothetical protein
VLPLGDRRRLVGAVVGRRVGAGGQGAGEHAQPGADGCEPEELEAGQRDEAGGEEDHAGREEHDAQRRDGAETPGETGDPEAGRHDRQQREAQACRRDVVHDDAHGDGDESDDRQVHARRDHRHAEGARRAASGRGGEYRDREDTVGGEEEAGNDRRAVEDVAGDVVEGSELREVQLPPQRIARGEDRDDHSRRECRHRSVTEVMGMVTGPVSRQCRTGDRGDAQAFGRGEEGQRTHVLQVRRFPTSSTPQVENFGNRRALCGRDPQISGGAAACMITRE